MSTADFARWWNETGAFEIRQVLYWKWDPLGVNDVFPATADEYDTYGPQVVQALRDGADEAAVDGLLSKLERGPMGLASRSEQREATALLLDWFEESQARWEELGPLPR